jgi:glycosyltransferase involved in cell wall biosynthesis
MTQELFVHRYDVPAAEPTAPRPELRWSRRGEGRLRELAGGVRIRARGRRLAYLDSHFPWSQSGFRYGDALALLSLRPDTVFFSMYECTDPFPARVLPLAEFPRVAPSLGITDVYGVFLNFMSGILGVGNTGEPGPADGLDLSRVLSRLGIRAHAGLYPGGGFTATTEGLEQTRRLVATADTVLSWSPVVIDQVAGITPIEPAIIDTGFYGHLARDFSARPLQLLFVADAPPRKGLTVAVEALTLLADEPVHLHVVGPHDPQTWSIPNGRATFHGWLGRDALRELHRRCHVFVSPVRAERPDDPSGDGGVTDGFPTTAAGESMSSGLLLISANPDRDHRVLRPGVDHIEIDAVPSALADAIRSVLAEPTTATATAASGSRRVRDRLDVRVGAAKRLELLGLIGSEPRSLRTVQAVGKLGQQLRELRGEDRQRSEVLEARTVALDRRVAELDRSIAALGGALQSMRSELVDLGRVAAEDESGMRRRLEAARSDAGYDRPFTDPEPLVSICIPTYTNHRGLAQRAIPSAFAQDYPKIEVIVVGDAAPAETEAALLEIDDPRIHYENLSVRGPYPEDPHRRWMVAGTGPLNRSIELARGDWVVILNDDDALRPTHVSRLLAFAQARHVEVAYGKFEVLLPDGPPTVLGRFPPEHGQFGWQAALHHRTIARLFKYELAAALFDEPGDWHRARRMLRAGVQFAMLDEVVFDYYPSKGWTRN